MNAFLMIYSCGILLLSWKENLEIHDGYYLVKPMEESAEYCSEKGVDKRWLKY